MKICPVHNWNLNICRIRNLHKSYHGHCPGCGSKFRLHRLGPAWRKCEACRRDVIVESCMVGVNYGRKNRRFM